jgi:hypothetical protein
MDVRPADCGYWPVFPELLFPTSLREGVVIGFKIELYGKRDFGFLAS